MGIFLIIFIIGALLAMMAGARYLESIIGSPTVYLSNSKSVRIARVGRPCGK